MKAVTQSGDKGAHLRLSTTVLPKRRMPVGFGDPILICSPSTSQFEPSSKSVWLDIGCVGDFQKAQVFGWKDVIPHSRPMQPKPETTL